MQGLPIIRVCQVFVSSNDDLQYFSYEYERLYWALQSRSCTTPRMTAFGGAKEFFSVCYWECAGTVSGLSNCMRLSGDVTLIYLQEELKTLSI